MEMKRLSKEQLGGLNSTIKGKIANQVVGFNDLLPDIVSVAKTIRDPSNYKSEFFDNDEDVEWLTSALLLLRNACVSPTARAELLTAGLPISFAHILNTLADIDQPNLGNHILILKYSIQVLANGCTDLNFAVQTWNLFFPGLFLLCIHQVSVLSSQGLIDKTGATDSPFTHHPKLCDAVSLTILRCCQRVPGAAQALCSHNSNIDNSNSSQLDKDAGPSGSNGAKLLEQLRLVCEATGDQGGSFHILLEYVCLHCGYLETLYNSTGLESFASFLGELFPLDEDESDHGQEEGPADNPNQDNNNILSTNIASQDINVCTEMETDAVKFTIRLIDKLAKEEKLKDPPPRSSSEQHDDDGLFWREICGRATLVHILKYWKHLTAQQEKCDDQCVKALHEGGAIRLLLSMLKAIQNNTPGPDGKLEVGQWRHLCPELEEEALCYPQASAQYDRFYKATILAIIGNACYGRKYFQDAVAALGGVDLLLCQCRGDMSSPLSREWALWAVRNLCEGNSEVQLAIAELKQSVPEGQQPFDKR